MLDTDGVTCLGMRDLADKDGKGGPSRKALWSQSEIKEERGPGGADRKQGVGFREGSGVKADWGWRLDSLKIRANE